MKPHVCSIVLCQAVKSPVTGTHSRPLAVVLMCFIALPPNGVEGPVFSGQPVLNARLRCVLGTNGDLTWDDWWALNHLFILPGLVTLFLWVYYSILGWTEWPSPRHAHSTGRRSHQTNQSLQQSIWHTVINTVTETIHMFVFTYISYQLQIKEDTGEPSMSAQEN